MANWQSEINLSEAYKLYDEGEISIQDICKSIVLMLGEIDIFRDRGEIESDRYNLIDEFECLAEDEGATEEDFNNIMERLYDWGDQKLIAGCGSLVDR